MIMFSLGLYYFRDVWNIFMSRQLIFYSLENIFTSYEICLLHWTCWKAVEFDKSLITRTRITTTTKSILRPLPQYLLAVKKNCLTCKGTAKNSLITYVVWYRLAWMFKIAKICSLAFRTMHLTLDNVTRSNNPWSETFTIFRVMPNPALKQTGSWD